MKVGDTVTVKPNHEDPETLLWLGSKFHVIKKPKETQAGSTIVVCALAIEGANGLGPVRAFREQDLELTA